MGLQDLHLHLLVLKKLSDDLGKKIFRLDIPFFYLI